jgi:DNA mismatch repair protein MutS2
MEREGKSAAKEHRREIQRETARLVRLETPARPRQTAVQPERIEVGGRYWSVALGREVEVVRGADATGRVLVRQGGLRVEIPASGLGRLAAPEPGGAPAPVPGIAIPEVEDVPSEVNLIGMRADEAMDVLERAVDRALLAGLREIRVVHGKGTGALRERVRAFCKTHASVSGFRVANQWEGGLGATIVELVS